MINLTYPVRPFPISTERLELRPYTIDDLDAVYGMQSLEEVARFQLWEVRDRDQARKWLEEKIEEKVTDEGGSLTLAVALPETGTIVGDVVLFVRGPGRKLGEVGAAFHPDFQGKGYASESVLAMMGLGFETFGLHRIICRCDARNTASTRAAERIGMRCEAHFIKNELVKGVWTDELLYAMLDTEWQERRSRLGPSFSSSWLI